MRNKFVRCMLTGALLIVGLSAPMSAVAQKAPEEIRLEKLFLKDADLGAAIQTLMKATGLKFVLLPSDTEFRRITLDLPDVSAIDAIRYVCDAAGAEFRRDANGVFIVGKNVGNAGGTIGIGAEPAKPIKRVLKKIKLMKADAYEIYLRIAQGKNVEPNRGFQQIRDFLKATDPFTKIPDNSRMPIIANTSGNYTPVPIDKVPATESGKDITLPGESASQFDGGGRQGGGGGGGGGNLGGGGGGGLGQGGGGNANLTPGQALVPGSIDFISYDPTDNSIVVRGSEEDIAELQRNINLFDVAPKQVQIKVEFVTTSSSLAKSLGFDWLYERGTMITGNRPGTFARSGDPIFLNYATGNVTARMRALIQAGQGKTVQAPVIRTLNNQPASIQQIVQTFIWINQVVSNGNNVIIVPQPFQMNLNTGLAVAPRINEDGTVTCFLNVPIQGFGQVRRGPNGQEIPDTFTQQIAVVARVRSGETIALGGMTSKTETGSESRFPVLGDLPIVGQFFRSKTQDRNNSELIIFVTPTVLEDDAGPGGP